MSYTVSRKRVAPIRLIGLLVVSAGCLAGLADHVGASDPMTSQTEQNDDSLNGWMPAPPAIEIAPVLSKTTTAVPTRNSVQQNTTTSVRGRHYVQPRMLPANHTTTNYSGNDFTNPISAPNASAPNRNVFGSLFPSLYGPPFQHARNSQQYQAAQGPNRQTRQEQSRQLQVLQQQQLFQQQPVWQRAGRPEATVQSSSNRIEEIKAAAEAAVLGRHASRQTDIVLTENGSASPISQVSYRSAPDLSGPVAATASPDLHKAWDMEMLRSDRKTSNNPYLLVSDSRQRTPPPAMNASRLTGSASAAPSRKTQTPQSGVPIFGIGKDLFKELRPTNDRTWSQNHAVLQTAEFNGSLVTIRNIRFSKYLSSEEYTTRYYDATFNLEEIRTIDLIIVPFHAMPSLAHVEASFGFADGRHIGLSIEARYEEGEKYDPVAASMRQFELIYVFADERDLIRIGTDVNKNDVLLYRLKFEPSEVREMFVDALQRANKLAAKPEFYHPLRNSCVTNLITHINKGRPKAIPREFRTLLPGLMDNYVFDLKLVDTTAKNFKEARENAKVNWLVEKYGDLEYFSAGIRQNLY